MIRFFKTFPEALQALTAALLSAVQAVGQVCERLDQEANVKDRVEALERSRATWEAEIEAHMTTAETRFKASRAAEERARGMERRAEQLAESFEGSEEGEEDLPQGYLDLIRQSNGEASEAEEVPAMHPSVGRAPTGRDRAKLAKWGRI